MNKVEQGLLEDGKTLAERQSEWFLQREHFLKLVEDPVLENTHLQWLSSGSGLYCGSSGTKENLQQLFKVFAQNGFHLPPTVERPQENQPEWSGCFVKKVEERTYQIYLSFTSTVCQRVQIGTEMKEVPVYEIHCGETEKELETSIDIPF